tara:strand:- start:111 stop:572 length:462 start_codon:yes stop_codon:yes gene_type:complete
MVKRRDDLEKATGYITEVDSLNRFRDVRRIEQRFPDLTEIPSKGVEFFSPRGKIATNYERVVYGDHGPYVEFTKDQLEPITIVKEKTSPMSYYDEGVVGNLKVYIQKRDVSNLPNPPRGRWSKANKRSGGYADYRPGYYYIAADDLQTVKAVE